MPGHLYTGTERLTSGPHAYTASPLAHGVSVFPAPAGHPLKDDQTKGISKKEYSGDAPILGGQ